MEVAPAAAIFLLMLKKHAQAQLWAPASLPGAALQFSSTAGYNPLCSHTAASSPDQTLVRTSDLEMQPFCMRGEELPLPCGFPLALLGSLLPPLIYDLEYSI